MREFCENKIDEKGFKMQNLSDAGLGKEQYEKDSFEIVEGREKEKNREGLVSTEHDEHIVKRFSRSQINAFVCC